MSSKALSLISPSRRDRVFEIRSMVNDIDAQDRSLESVGEAGMEIDEVLEDIIDLITNEVKLARKRKRRFSAA